MTKKVDIRLLQEAQDIIANLRAKLSGESFVSHEHYAALQLERDELAARVGELVGHMQTITDCLSEAIDSKQSYDHFQRSTSANNTAYELINSSKPASLARHDAGVLKNWAHKRQMDIGQHVYELAMLDADRIEQEADNNA